MHEQTSDIRKVIYTYTVPAFIQYIVNIDPILDKCYGENLEGIYRK